MSAAHYETFLSRRYSGRCRCGPHARGLPLRANGRHFATRVMSRRGPACRTRPFRRGARCNRRRKRSERAAVPELPAAIARHALPLAPFRDLLSAFKQDVTTTRYSRPRIVRLLPASANPTALMLRIFGAEAPANLVRERRRSARRCSDPFWQTSHRNCLRGGFTSPLKIIGRSASTKRRSLRHAGRSVERSDGVRTARARALIESDVAHAALHWRCDSRFRSARRRAS